MAKSSLSWISQLISAAENLWERYAIGWNCPSLPYWEGTEFNAKFDASASKKKSFEESACTRIGADVNAFLSS
jgi:hypothetical protein